MQELCPSMHPGIAEEVHLTKHSLSQVLFRNRHPKQPEGCRHIRPYSWELPTSNFGSAEESDHASAAARIPCAPDHGAQKGGAEGDLGCRKASCKQGALAPETKTLPTWHLLDAYFPYFPYGQVSCRSVAKTHQGALLSRSFASGCWWR